MVLRDPYALHRDWYTGEPDGPLNEWTSWDFSLAMATQLIIDGTTENGNLRWEVEDENADIVIVHEINREREAIDAIQNNDSYKPSAGEWLRPTVHHPYWDPESGEPQPFLTRGEWVAKLMEQEEDLSEID